MRHVLWLPEPPSHNDCWRPVRRGKFAAIIMTDVYREYRAEVGRQLEWKWNRAPIPRKRPIAITLVAFRSNPRRDLSNYWKAGLDVLQPDPKHDPAPRVLENDNCMVEQRGYVRESPGNGRIVFILTNPGAPVNLRGIE